MTTIRIGISTCPNDTFAFHGLINGKVDSRGLDFEFEYHDVQVLNQKLFDGSFDVAKGSFHAALLLSKEFGVLSSGSALGFGNGPLLLSAIPDTNPNDDFFSAEKIARNPIVLCPGEHTTATLLYKIFFPGAGQLEQVIFSDIMPRLTQQKADFGVCIHEGRFTYQNENLGCVADLGNLWEERTQSPLPLGGIFAKKSIDGETLKKINDSIGDSIEYGHKNRQETVATMSLHAQEFSEEVLFQHVDLYVNQWTTELGTIGRKSIETLCELASKAGLIQEGLVLEILGV